jgi:hypothetical protein
MLLEIYHLVLVQGLQYGVKYSSVYSAYDLTHCSMVYFYSDMDELVVSFFFNYILLTVHLIMIPG